MERPKEVDMSRTIGTITAVLLSFLVVSASAQESAMEDRLISFTHEIRMSLTLATIAAKSPTLADLKLHAQQLVNMLEGGDGQHFVRLVDEGDTPVGLLADLDDLRPRLETGTLSVAVLARISTSVRNVATFLDLALSAALDGLSRRRLTDANADLLRAYAFLLAAYEKPCEAAYIPGWWTILRAYNLASRLGDTQES
jgi:hypothetical protein